MSITTAYKNSIVLQIDEANRTITNGGKNIPIVLGVKGDDCAERVYFESPKILSPEIDLLENTENKVKTNVYINYKSATNDVYIQECSDVAQSATSDVVTFSWIVTNNATEAKGEVKFNVCVKRTVYNETTGAWELTNEWHTTPFIGKVLDSIDVSRKTPEIITHDSVTMEALTVQVNAYAAEVNTYAANLETLNESLADVNAYVDGVVGEAVTKDVDSKMGNYLLLTGGSLSGRLDANGGIWATELNFGNSDEVHIDQNGMTINGGEVVTKNNNLIEMSAGGIIYKDGMNANEYAGFCIAPQGVPVIVSKDLSLCFTTSEDYVMYTHEYKFPQNSGTLLLDTLQSGEGIHCQDGGFFSAGGYPAIATSDGSLFVSSGQFNTSQGVWLKFPSKPGYLALASTTQTLYQGNTAEIDARSASENAYYSIAIALSKVPTVGSKLKIYFGDGKNTSANLYNTFVLDLIVSEGADDIIVGQTSHYILMKNPDKSEVSFEGIINVNLYSSENTLDCLHVNLLVKTFDDYVISGTGLERSVQFCVNKVEMITEN